MYAGQKRYKLIISFWYFRGDGNPLINLVFSHCATAAMENLMTGRMRGIELTKLVRLELEEDRHLQFVQEQVEQLRLLDDDLTIVCSGGHTLLTNSSFLGLHSAVVREAGQQGATLLVPASREEVGLLYELLVRGEVTSSNRDQLETVTSLLHSLGIRNNGSISNITAKVKVKKSQSQKFKNKWTKIEPEDPLDGENLLNESTGDFDEKLNVTASEDGSFNCPKCDKDFPILGRLRAHLIVHTKEKNYQCKECGKCFGTAGILSNHLGVHFPTPCDKCERTFAQKSSFKKHMMQEHWQN